MKAIQYNASAPRRLLGKALGADHKPFFWSGLSCLRYSDAPGPTLPGPEWAEVRTRTSRLSGSQWNLIPLCNNPYLSPSASRQLIAGREKLGTCVFTHV